VRLSGGVERDAQQGAPDDGHEHEADAAGARGHGGHEGGAEPEERERPPREGLERAHAAG
jgi:hypothetical protein